MSPSIEIDMAPSEDDVRQLAEVSHRAAASVAVSQQVNDILQERVAAALASKDRLAAMPWVTGVSVTSGFMGGNLERQMTPREAGSPTSSRDDDEGAAA